MRTNQLSTKQRWQTWTSDRIHVFILALSCLFLTQTNSSFGQSKETLPKIKAEKVEDRGNFSNRPTFIAPDIERVPAGMTVKTYNQAKSVAYSNSAERVDPAANPNLPADIACSNLDVIFVLDESGSINSTEAASVRTGAMALANALNGSGATLRIIEFNTTSTIVNLGVTTVDATFISRLNSYLNTSSGYNSQKYSPTFSGCTGWTNWQDALDDVQTVNADLVMFFTDGNPTAYNNSNGDCGVSGARVRVGDENNYSFNTALGNAVSSANVVKGQGKHMFTIGVGTESEISVSNLIAISGPDNFAVTPNIFTADYSVSDFTGLAANLTAAVNTICGTTLNLSKTVNPTGVCANGNVQFTITVTNTGGLYNHAAQNLVVSDVFPNGFSALQIVAPVPSGASISGQTLTYNIGSLAAGSSKTIKVNAHVGIPPANFNNTAIATANNANTVQSSAAVAVGYATASISPSACNSYSINGQTYQTSGTYTQTLQSVGGCDSVLTINLTINHPTTSTTSHTACDSYTWNGTTYTTSGLKTFQTTGSKGCDSTATLNLTINQSSSSYTSQTACIEYTWNGTTYNQSGIYVHETVNSAGCPNLDTLNLTITPQPAQPELACYQTATFNQQTCSWDITGEQPAAPSVLCYETATWNGQTCSYDVTGEQPAAPTVLCYETATWNGQTCSYDVTGEQPAAPSVLCYETATWNGQTCSYDVTGEQPAAPSVLCYETATWNGQTCSYDVTGEQPAAPSVLCYETATWNGETCSYDVTGEQPAAPSVLCYETATWNGQTCSYDVTGEQPAAPSVLCYETATWNGETCSYDVTGEQPAAPSVLCYETATWNGETCSYDVTGEQPAAPSVLCYETATWNGETCSYDVTGEQPAAPSVLCYETATWNGETCSYDVTGEQPAAPSVLCYETATWNGQTCSYDVTGEQPAAPSVLCYETATWNGQTCSYDVTGEQPAAPSVLCYETATWNGQTCSYDVTGEQPAAPSVLCYETATWNGQTCSYDVTGEQPAAPSVLCYETATWNGQTCSYDVTGEQPAAPSVLCYETATWNGQTCSYDVTGEQPAAPSVQCYETATWNGETCSYDVTGEQPEMPETSCFEYATFNSQSCAWDIHGGQPPMPEVACYETAIFNEVTCAWDVTGEQPAAPSVLCYETATWNGTTCSYDVTGEQPAAPSVLCYETATWNGQTCSYDVTGEQPAAPSVLCYETATWNGQTCSYDVTGEQPAAPSVLCYETATWNGQTCSYDVTGEQPAAPSVLCYETATWNGTTCSWDVTGEQPAAPSVLCYETATWNGQTCSYDVTGEQPAAPSVLCYETATWNGETCSYDVTGEQPAAPSVLCYETATWNGQTCSYDVTGEQPAAPSVLCYETATWNGETCSYDVTGEQPAAPSVLCYETATWNGETCSYDVTGEQPAAPSVLCYETATWNGETCSYDVTGEQPAAPSVLCYETATWNSETCSYDVTGEQPAAPSVLCYETATWNGETCSYDVTGEPNAAIVTEAVACESYTWSVDGNSYDESGVYFYSADCQNYELHLTINHSSVVTNISATINEGESYAFDGNNLTVGGTYTAHFENAAGCDSTVTLVLTVIPPVVEGCVGAQVVFVNQGLTKAGNAVRPERSIPSRVLGAPDAQNPSVYAPQQYFFSLGFGGSIEIDFGYNIANGPGNDIKIWESSASANAEKARIEVSQDGLGYVPVGTVSQGGEVDFGGVYSDYIRFVRIVDISNPAQFSNTDVTDGYDVDGVECIHGRYVQPSCTGVEVLSVNQGKRADGSNVPADRSDVNNALDLPVAAPVGTVDFFALGFGGEITLAFAGPVANGPGNDIRIVETTWGYTCANYPETANVFASQDGLNYVYLGSTCMTGEFDLGSLSWAQFIKIMDVSDPSMFPANADGYDLNGIECLNGPAETPGDDGLVPCVMTQVLSYNPGLQKNGAAINPMRNDANKALGAPQGNDTYNFVSLGFGGSIELGFDFVVFNNAGNDIQVIETSFGNPSCTNYPEHAQVAASIDGVSWINLGELCLDGTIDLGSMTFAQFVRITDSSNPGSSRFGGSADGFDVDAVVALGHCYATGSRLAADNTTTPDEALSMSMFPNPADDFTVLNIEGTISGDRISVEVFDAAGRLIETQSINASGNNTTHRLDVNSYAKGVYMIVVQSGSERFVQRLVK